MTKLLFLDFEASSLLPGGYPIEVGWVDDAGHGESHLIRPASDWLDWDYNSQAMHNLSREQLEQDGAAPDFIAARLMAAAQQAWAVYSDAPGWDGGWLDTLLDEAGHPLRLGLVDVRRAYVDACRPLLRRLPLPSGPGYAAAERQAQRLCADLVNAAVFTEENRERVRHRALADAESLWRTWADVRRRVNEALRG